MYLYGEGHGQRGRRRFSDSRSKTAILLPTDPLLFASKASLAGALSVAF